MKYTTLSLSLSLLTPVVNASVEAQTSQVEVIEVKAQKRVQNIDDVAITLTVINGVDIQQQNLKDTTALSGQVSNFKITQNAAEGTPPALNIRGVGSLDYNTSTTSPVGVYVDNVAGGSSNAQLVNLYDIEAVEVLKGPQGTLFGRNTTGGAILVHTQKPTQDFEGYVQLGIAEQDHQKLEGALNLPVSEQVASRFAFSHQDYDYSVNNLHPQAPEAGMKQTSARFSLLADYDKWNFYFKAHAEKWDGIVQPPGSIGVIKQLADPSSGQQEVLCSPEMAGTAQCTNRFGFNGGTQNFHDVAVNNEVHDNSPHTTDSWGVDAHIEYRIDADTYISSISSYNELDRVHLFNSDASPMRIAEGGQNVDTKVFTQELRLHKQWQDWYFIAGLYYLREDLIQDNFLDLFRDFRSNEAAFSNAAQFFYDNNIDTEARAAFVHSEYSISDKTSISMGLRYTDEKIDYTVKGQVNVARFVDDLTGLTVPTWDIAGGVKDNNLSGKIALNHKWSAVFNTYFSYARGFKSGGYNGAIITTAAEAERNDYGSEHLNAYELGGRYFWDQRNAYLQFAVFNYDYKDQQVFMNQAAISAGAPPVQLLDNVGNSQIYGAEADLSWQLTSAFKARFGVGYLPKAELEEFVDARGDVITDNRLPFTSRWNINGFFDYVVPLNEAELLFQLNFDHQSRFYFDQNQSAYAQQDSYTLLNGRVAYEHDDWVLAVWGKNLTDKEYSYLKFDLIGLVGALQDFKAPERQLGVDFKYRF